MTSAGHTGSNTSIEYAWKKEIPDKVFSYCKFDKILFPSTISKIGNDIIEQGSVKNIYIEALTPPESLTNWYSSNLFVPEGCSSAYASSHNWSNCNIVELVNISNISFAQPSYDIIKGVQKQLEIDIRPLNATYKTIYWESKNPEIATVSKTGIVTGIHSGTTEIIARTTDGTNIETSCEVIVTNPIREIIIDNTEVSLEVGDSIIINTKCIPEDADDITIKWNVSDTSIVQINKGIAKAISVGHTTITAIAINGVTAQCNITVKPTLANSIVLEKNYIDLHTGEKDTLYVTLTPNKVTNKDITWKSQDNHIVSVSPDGVITALSNGSTIITATTNDGTNLSASCNVNVTTLAKEIKLNKTKDSLIVGETLQLIPIISPNNTSNKQIEWKSNNETVAKVSDEGLITALSTGTTEIFAHTVDGTELFANCVITISNPVKEISINKPNAEIRVNEKIKLVAQCNPSNADDLSIVWTSEDENIATVKDGIVTGISVGIVTITAKTINGHKASCTVNVVPTPVNSIDLGITNINLIANEQYLLIPNILPKDATNKELNWTSDNLKVAIVNTEGLITALSSGKACVTAMTTDNSGVYATCLVNVTTPVNAITLSTNIKEKLIGTSFIISAVCTPSNADNTALQWSSDNEEVATVSQDGTVTAKSAGIATITATTTDGSDISASCKVTVKKHPQSIVWEQSLDGLAVGGSVIEVNAKTSSGLPVSYYSSADERIVNLVSINGKLYLNPVSQGTTTVTARFTGNNYYADAELTRTVTVKEGQKSTITFDSNGGSGVMAITSLCGAQIDCPQSPERDGYTFTGWKPAFPATMPYEDMTLTAQWKPNKYKVTFIADRNVMQENTLDYGTEIIQPTKEPKKTGYSFIGWAPAVDATVPNHNVTYNAVFKRESHKITFNTDGGSVVEAIEGLYDSEYAQPQQPVKTGYSFAGWQPSLPERIPAEDMSVKALWKLNSPLADRNETEADYVGYIVSLTSEASDTKMYYTTDGSEPTTASALYTKPIIIDNDITLKAIAIDKNNSKSEAAMFVFSVIKMPKIQIGEGWNWVTINANGKQSAISDVLSVGEWTLGDEVKDDSKAISFSGEKKRWYGTLGVAAFDNSKMYKIHSAKNQTLTTNINAVNPEKVEISVMSGWNYIAYPLTTTEMLAEALANYDAEDGDIIKSQEQFSVYNAKTATWQGELKALTPGRGYMIKRKAGARNVKFRFMANTGVTGNEETELSSKYANNMNLIATISGLPIEDGDSIVAVCDNEMYTWCSAPFALEILNDS